MGLKISLEDLAQRRRRLEISLARAPEDKTFFGEKPPPPYSRSFSLIQRLYGVLRKPSETMRDIGLAPDYGGVTIILIFQIALMIGAISISMSKIHIIGTYATEVNNAISGAVALATGIGVFLVLLRWAVKSAIVWKACDEASGWSFSSAAAVTGYAYFVEVIVNIIWMVLISVYMPVLQLDVSNLEAAVQALESYKSQVIVLALYRLPITFLTLIWKSYLGGIGAHHGTREMCSKTKGIAVFLILSLIGVIISIIISPL